MISPYILTPIQAVPNRCTGVDMDNRQDGAVGAVAGLSNAVTGGNDYFLIF